MNAKYADAAYIEKAKLLSAEEMERVLSRMGDKLRKKKFKDKIDCLAAVAIQLEIEDAMLSDWRENFAKIKAKHDKKEARNAPEIVPEKSKIEPEVEVKPKPEPAAKKPAPVAKKVASASKPVAAEKPVQKNSQSKK